MNNNKIRMAQDKDIEKIIEILVQVNMIHHNARPDIFKGPTTKYTAEELNIIIHNESTPVFVYTDDEDNVLGYLFCIFKKHDNDNLMTDIKTLYIDDLCVDENARGQHIGKKLFEYAVDFARKQDCYNVTLNVWSSNTDAMRFYEKCGLIPQKITLEKIL